MHRLYPALLLVSMFLFSPACKNEGRANPLAQPESQDKAPGEAKNRPGEIVLDINTIFQNKPLDTILIKFDFEVKKKNKRYRGLYTKPIFAELVRTYAIDTSLYDMLFLCKDGYSASVPFSQLLTDQGFIASKDVDAKLQWEDALNDKFSPFYLVWNLDKDDHNHSFPYGITHLKIASKKDEFIHAFPVNATASVEKGFAIFKKNCIKCHSINGAGGAVGPELNVPKNVTEYWKAEHLREFIKNPTNYRYNSKMPMIAELSPENVQSIVDYLTFMAGQKRME